MGNGECGLGEWNGDVQWEIEEWENVKIRNGECRMGKKGTGECGMGE